MSRSKVPLKMLPKSAWPVSPYTRGIRRGPRPQLEVERREAIAEMDTITAAPKGSRCVAVIGYGVRTEEEKWAVLRWSGAPPTEILCKEKATVHIGCNFCTEHGAEHLAGRMRQLLRDGYQVWDFETRKRLTSHPLTTRWQEWDRAIGWPLYHEGQLDSFGLDSTELGVRVCEVWHPDYFSGTDDYFVLDLPDFADPADGVSYARAAAASLAGALS